jgi:CDP-paratose 2-epimerase
MRPILITGGAGFIATNLAHRLLSDGHRVVLFDNLSRAGVIGNVRWLRATHGNRVRLQAGDIRDAEAVRLVVADASHIFHFAAQVAVTTSLVDPFVDFDVNARGTLNLLEAVRATEHQPSVLFTSTNKVYGHLDDIGLRTAGSRYEPEDPELRTSGISEARSLEFHSPYGCSKGVAEQYVLDYARTFGLRTVVFRMSCIYGPHQFGNEDQGWVAHFLIAAMRDQALTIYGDGLQVRDILFVEDLVQAMVLAHANIDQLSGEAFNIGGGSENTMSLVELMRLIEELRGATPPAEMEMWRTADQRYYVSDTSKFRAATGWRPTVGVREGVSRLHDWLVENQLAEASPAERGGIAS